MRSVFVFVAGLLVSCGVACGDVPSCAGGVCVMPVCASAASCRIECRSSPVSPATDSVADSVDSPSPASVADAVPALPLSEGLVLRLGDVRCSEFVIEGPTGSGTVICRQRSGPVPSSFEPTPAVGTRPGGDGSASGSSAPVVSLLRRFHSRRALIRVRRRSALCRLLGCP